MSTCTNCNGGGLSGSGDKPWEKVGQVVTCPKCGGTGKIDDEQAQDENADGGEQAQDQQSDTQKESGDDQQVENQGNGDGTQSTVDNSGGAQG